MDTKDIIQSASLAIAILGWGINSHINRRNEIAKKRLEFRLQMFDKLIEIKRIIDRNGAPFTDTSFEPALVSAREKFQLYGKKNEIYFMEKFIKSIEELDLDNARSTLNTLFQLIPITVRDELKIDEKTYLKFFPY